LKLAKALAAPVFVYAAILEANARCVCGSNSRRDGGLIQSAGDFVGASPPVRRLSAKTASYAQQWGEFALVTLSGTSALLRPNIKLVHLNPILSHQSPRSLDALALK
jgi:hypothetical protein